MKILYVTTVSLTLNTFLIPHIKHLIENGHEVQIASNIDVEVSKEFVNSNIKHTKIDFSRNPFSLSNKKAYTQIKELQKKECFDIVHVHTPVASFVTRLALKNEDIKIIYTAHGFHFYNGAPLINWVLYYPLEKIAAKWTDTLVTINNEDFERAKKFKLRNDGQIELMHGVGMDPNEYEFTNFNKEQYREDLGLDKNDFVLLVLAELNKNKNHVQIINAMEILKDKYPNIKVLCAGKGPLEEKLKELVKEKRIDNNIKFIGFRSDIKELLYISDCIGLFSMREGLGKCLLEGMITGKALIATNTRGPKELIEHNKNGFLVKIGDYKSTAKYIEELYLDNEKRSEFGEISKIKVKNYFMENILVEIYNIHFNYDDIVDDILEELVG